MWTQGDEHAGRAGAAFRHASRMEGGSPMARTHHTGGHHVMLSNLVFLLLLGVGTALGGAGDTPRRGGTLRVAAQQTPSLDPTWTSVIATIWISNHYVERLYTTGKDGSPIPMLADGHMVSDDGRVYTFKLRRGVLFHHGKEMTAADVIPS